MNVYSSFIRNSQKLETTNMFFNRWIVKQLVVQPLSLINSAINRFKLLIHATTWVNLQRVKNTMPKDSILYDPIYITSLKWKNYRNREQISGCQGLKGRVRVGSRRGYQTATKGILKVGGNVLDCTNVSISVVTLNYTCAGSYDQGKLSKEDMGSLCNISYTCMWIYSYLKIRSLILKNQLNIDEL